jgi:hypothetical protein
MSHASTARHALIVDNFRELVRFCAALESTRYHPVRLNLKIKALQDALAVAEARLSDVERTHADLASVHDADPETQRLAHLAHDRAREALNVVLFAPGEGIVDLANDGKIYLKTLKGPKEPELHHITHLEFRAPG